MMEFRPCIDIHNGQVKQIIGGTLQDANNTAVENFTSQRDASYFANLYKMRELKGGHVIMLNASDSNLYPATKRQAILALAAYPNGLQIGGGITDENAAEYLDAGASHVIITSFLFQDGQIRYDNLDKIKHEVGKEKLVIDVSCRKKNDAYYVVTNRWQQFTNVKMSVQLLEELSTKCDEFLIHAVDVEGRQMGIEENVVSVLADYAFCKREKGNARKVTYAGGIANYEDIEKLNVLGRGRVNATIGSALDLFGGKLEFDKVIECFQNQ